MCAESPSAVKARRPRGGPAYLRVYALAVERCPSRRIASSDRSNVSLSETIPDRRKGSRHAAHFAGCNAGSTCESFVISAGNRFEGGINEPERSVAPHSNHCTTRRSFVELFTPDHIARGIVCNTCGYSSIYPGRR